MWRTGEIRRLHRSEQIPIRAIARKLGSGRNAVRRTVLCDAGAWPPPEPSGPPVRFRRLVSGWGRFRWRPGAINRWRRVVPSPR
ncbi:hypothetical protein ETD96_37650 [Actinomadura geliboluensis]|uniref:Uncharacterized protein n=1 Tax=Actinomadura geliboluensis TaxID=882440 RepID=A0A5S4G5R1_9ACTN|nr:hypothetical protein ETD96_37650 [Actinomadura geliboluensis]